MAGPDSKQGKSQLVSEGEGRVGGTRAGAEARMHVACAGTHTKTLHDS
jgi:hypothetical protein